MLIRWLLVPAIACGCGRVRFDTAHEVADGALDAADPSLILAFPFDVDFDDVHGAHPTCAAGTCPTQVPGKHGKAARFDGIDDCLVLADDGSTDVPHLTLALWVNRARLDEYAPFSKPFQMATTSFNSWQYEEHIDMMIGFTTHNAGRHDTLGVLGPVVGAWHHLAMTFDGATKLLYVDGAPIIMTGEPDAVQYDNGPVLIGCDINSNAVIYPFAGMLDDVRFYDRALSAAEIAALAQ